MPFMFSLEPPTRSIPDPPIPGFPDRFQILRFQIVTLQHYQLNWSRSWMFLGPSAVPVV